MKMNIRNRFLVLVLVAAFGSVLAGQASAQTFTNLYNFSGGSDGANPYAGLLLSSNTLYGTAYTGGDAGLGTVFSVNTDGAAFTRLYSFSGNDGAKPHGALVLSGNVLYGTTGLGGPNNSGTVFAVNTDGTGFQTLHAFSATLNGSFGTNDDGDTPAGALILENNTLFGTALYGGGGGNGTVFKVNTDGTGFTTIYSFSGGTDGGVPQGTLVLSGGTLYGAAYAGGTSGNGTVFKVKTDGTGFATLHSFTATPSSPPYVNSDGTSPNGLILSGQTLFGAAGAGGRSGSGTLFAINTDGTGFRILHSFTGSDGRNPVSPLLLSGSTLYGAALSTGNSGSGTIFALNPNGSGFTNVYGFTTLASCCPSMNNDGATPHDGLFSSGKTLYGTAEAGGTSGYGTIFSMSLPFTRPQLTISSAGPNAILSWSTNFTGFTLQSTTNLGSPVWSTNLPAPVVVNGQNTVTNPISGTQQFFRLSQ